MNKKTISISLPKIEGIELKSATVDLKKGVVVAEYREEDRIKAKKGDFLTLKTDPSKVVIFGSMEGMLGGVAVFSIIYDLPTYINGIPAFTPKGVKMPISRFRHSTEEEKALMIEEMEKWGKRYNPKTFRIEDIGKDISEIAISFRSAIDYLLEDTHRPYLHTTTKHISKLDAFNSLIILAESWNEFDEFYPDWEDHRQEKHYPSFAFKNGKFEFSHVSFQRRVVNTHVVNFGFKTEERAEQFGRQFIDLFRVVLTN